jgi:4'-phosphopantetheinyl transferase
MQPPSQPRRDADSEHAPGGVPAAGAIALARVDLSGPLPPAEALLDEPERERAARFLRPEPRRRFTLARAGLRRLMGAALGEDPRSLRFAEEQHGRPHLAGPHDGALEFNLAHSGELALIAFAPAGPLGVDLEAERPIERLEALAEEVLGAAELDAWRALAPGERAAAFLVAWTRKEAVLKATGLGLSGGLRELDVRGPSPLSVGPRGPAPGAARPAARITGGNGAPVLWVHDLEVAPGYRAALASAWAEPRLIWWHLPATALPGESRTERG